MEQTNEHITEINTQQETTQEVLQEATQEVSQDMAEAMEQAVEVTPKKANPFVQLIKGLAYFLFFLAAQVIATFVLMIYYGIQKSMEYIAAGSQPAEHAREMSEYMQSQTLGNTNVLFLINALFLFLPLLIWFAIRKKNFFVETRMRKFSPKHLPILLLITLGIGLFVNSALNLLPTSWIASYSQDSSFAGEGTLIGSLVAQAIIAPLTEEITFRGLMLSRFNKGLPAWIGIVISSGLFGVMHGNPIWFVYAALLGVVFCLIANRTNSILSTIIIHALFNSLGTVLAYARFEVPGKPILAIICVIGAGILGVSLYWFFKATKATA
ncbi:MAG: CPBP family intramembrane metalloprotease [Lachnospiraceae bacterium]|nr:CPBP family intramembrane metalloprotease [Lachnospiraceae bacterium]MBP5733695.1 CPBP family intramembrane metalloprotease [Lachnospiraceae bacterium]